MRGVGGKRILGRLGVFDAMDKFAVLKIDFAILNVGGNAFIRSFSPVASFTLRRISSAAMLILVGGLALLVSKITRLMFIGSIQWPLRVSRHSDSS